MDITNSRENGMISMRSIVVLPLAAIIVAAAPLMASAHISVTPDEVNVGEYPTFSVNVPVEKGVATTDVRLVVPDGLNYVQPNVKAGWKISTKKSGKGLEATVTEIRWSGGSIPAEQREQFLFAAQAPEMATELNWKAYQTYADGTVVAWNEEPTDEEAEGSKPYSVTKVTNDLSDSTDARATGAPVESSDMNGTLGLIAGVIAIVISVGAILFRKK